MTKTLKDISESLATALGGRATKLSHCDRTFMIAGAAITVDGNTYKLLVRVTDEYSTAGETYSINFDSISKVGGMTFKVNSFPIQRGVLADDQLYDTYCGFHVDASLPIIVAEVQKRVYNLYECGINRNQQRERSKASRAVRAEAKLNDYTFKLADEIGCDEQEARKFVNDASAYVKGAKIYDLARTIALRVGKPPIITGYTVARRDGTSVGEWRAWMAHFDDLAAARAGAMAHIEFLTERGQDVVLATLYAST